jgi:hypothetical protein
MDLTEAEASPGVLEKITQSCHFLSFGVESEKVGYPDNAES